MPCPRFSRALAVGLLIAPQAWAQQQPEVGQEEPIDPVEVDNPRFERAIDVAVAEYQGEREATLGPRESTVTLAVGALGFMREGLAPGPALGPAWSLRYGFHPVDSLMAWEIGLLTSTHTGEGQVEADVFVLETAIKVSAVQQRPWSPLVAMGLGYGMFAGPVQSDLGSLVLPVTVGLEGGTEQILAGLRATWRPAFFERDVIGVGLGHDTWQILADVGARF